MWKRNYKCAHHFFYRITIILLLFLRSLIIPVSAVCILRELMEVYKFEIGIDVFFLQIIRPLTKMAPLQRFSLLCRTVFFLSRNL